MVCRIAIIWCMLVCSALAMHPLTPLIQQLEAELPRIQQISGYTATLDSQFTLGGKLQPRQRMYLAVRHTPFSVYMRFALPIDIAGREVIYEAGRNGGNLLAHGTGTQAMLGTLTLDPKGRIAMKGQAYPLTEIGVLNLTVKLATIARTETRYDARACRIIRHLRRYVGGRICTCYEIVHVTKQPGIEAHLVRVYVADDLQIPIGCEAYGWPARAGETPPLIERYVYSDLRVTGLTDADFDVRNPRYGFSEGG